MSVTVIVIAVIVGIVLGLALKSVDTRGPGSSVRAKPRMPEPSNGSEASDPEIYRIMADGRKIEAIKLYRETHGVGLKQAKEAVERMAQQPPPAD